MSNLLCQTFLAVRPLWVIQQRLSYHVAAEGRLLYGLKFDKQSAISLEARGPDDLPFIQPTGYEFIEDRSLAGGSAPLRRGNSNAVDSFTATFMLTVERQFGMFRDDPTADASTTPL